MLLRHLRDLPGLSRNKIQRVIDSGGVQVNGRPAPRASCRIAAGDSLSIELPETVKRTRPIAEPLPLEVIFEDDDLVVVNKPPGQVTHPAFRNTSGTLLNALLAHAEGAWTPRLLNRLDKHTSGLVLVAKRRSIAAALSNRAIEKEYLAIVSGRPSPPRGTIQLALDRDPWDRRRVMVRDRGGQPSATRYQRVGVSADRTMSLVRCHLVTGRTHQIRVHLAARGWPVLGDATYGRRDRRIARQALHAWKLAFDHPRTRGRMTLTAPVPADMRELMAECSLDVPEFAGTRAGTTDLRSG